MRKEVKRWYRTHGRHKERDSFAFGIGFGPDLFMILFGKWFLAFERLEKKQ